MPFCRLVVLIKKKTKKHRIDQRDVRLKFVLVTRSDTETVLWMDPEGPAGPQPHILPEFDSQTFGSNIWRFVMICSLYVVHLFFILVSWWPRDFSKYHETTKSGFFFLSHPHKSKQRNFYVFFGYLVNLTWSVTPAGLCDPDTDEKTTSNVFTDFSKSHLFYHGGFG